ncbi:MAG: alpha-N-acetylglucosaminidase [Gemmatimonadales bacterium]|nr:alpha-N-acetylglucosaminidase [Gemmatimonadales bacterium]
MKRRAPLGIVALALLALARPAGADAPVAPDLAAAHALIARVIPGRARDFSIEAIPADSGFDTFEVESRSGRIVLRGSSGVAIASALNWYLEHVAGITVDNPLRPIHLRSLPAVPAKVHVTTPYTYRYFFNYCTFSYSMAWWDWRQWERMIDWMALKGINMPLAATGQEGTWQLVLRDLGFTDAQIGAFLVGPAYLPWGWMGNIDGLGGPLPDSWIRSHVALERQILARERSLGMRPVLQGFTGHVPESIRSVFPDAKIHRTGDWSAGFSGTWFLDPLDPLFQRIGRRFIERQTELFGTDHLYAADTFNEIDPPTSDSTFLAGMGRTVYESMRAADPHAVWVLQGWFLYYQAKFWKEPQARALLGAVPDDRMIVLDLYGDRYPVWKERKAFYGKPWIWNVLYNFGGQVSLYGDLPSVARNLNDAVISPAKGRLAGIGMMMEGLGYNPIVPDYVMDLAWRTRVPQLEEWSESYVARRYGGVERGAQAGTPVNPQAWSAWRMLLATVYRSAPQTGTYLAERPGFYDPKARYRSAPTAPYDPKLLAVALDTLLRAAPALSGSDAYRYDVVNLARQVLGGLGLPFVNAVEEAYGRKDRAALVAREQRVLGLIRDLDDLTGTRPELLLGPWLGEARRWGRTREERNLYEWNARNIITLWGTKCTEGENDDLNLYAHKEWQGMFRNYYLPRWEAFFAGLDRALDAGKAFDRKPFAAEMCAWEQEWSGRHDTFPVTAKGDEIETARRLYAKYRNDLGT